MAKGVSVKVTSYKETVPKVFDLIKLPAELKKHDKIVIKPNLFNDHLPSLELLEMIVKFCLENKNPEAEIFIAEGSDGKETEDVFEESGISALATKYSLGLIDLNHTETEEIQNPEFLSFEKLHFPKLLRESFVISVSNLSVSESSPFEGSLYSMLGAYPSKHYKGFFTLKKTKLKNIPLKNQIHDILKCKMPNLGIIDVPSKNTMIVGHPLEMDKQATKLAGLDWKNTYLRLIDESFSPKPAKESNIDKLIGNS